MNPQVAVLFGGWSAEREVSLVSGKNVVDALVSLGKYEVVPVVLDANNLDALCRRFSVDNSARTRHGALLDCELLARM